MVLPLVVDKATIFKKMFIANCLADSFSFALLADEMETHPDQLELGKEGLWVMATIWNTKSEHLERHNKIQK